MSKAVPAIRFILFEAGYFCVMKSRLLRCCSWEQLRRYVPCVTVVVRPVWGGISACLLSRLPRDAASCVIRDYLDVWKHRFSRDVISRQARCVSVFDTVVLTTVWSGIFMGIAIPRFAGWYILFSAVWCSEGSGTDADAFPAVSSRLLRECPVRRCPVFCGMWRNGDVPQAAGGVVMAVSRAFRWMRRSPRTVSGRMLRLLYIPCKTGAASVDTYCLMRFLSEK